MYKQCKTKQAVERQHKIGEMLMKLMKKQPYAKISVSELCRECYISRNVFYRYFDNIEDVFAFAADELVQDLIRYTSEFPEGEASFKEQIERFFEYWYEQRWFLKMIIENNLLEVLFRQFIKNACEHQIGIRRMSETMPEEYYPLVVNFALYGLESLLINWHNQNYETSPEKMGEAYRHLLTNPLFKTEKSDSF